MPDSMTVQIVQRGLITLPNSIRQRYHLQTGDSLTLIDLGGVFVLSPLQSQIDYLAEEVRAELAGSGESLETILQAVREQRLSYSSENG